MALSPNINNREFDKFNLNSDGKTAVDVIAELSSGSVNIRAPTGPFEITNTTVTDAATDPIPVPLDSRAAISIRNRSDTDTIWFGKNALVTADDATGTGGWDILPREDFNFDIDESTPFFLIAATGKTPRVKIIEIAST